MIARARLWSEFARPFTLLVPAIGFATTGFASYGRLRGLYGSPGTVFEIPWGWPAWIPILLGTVMAATLNIASNGINQIYDLEIDRVNKPARPIPSGRMGVGEAWLVTGLAYAASFLLAWLVVPIRMASDPAGPAFRAYSPGLADRQCFWIVAVAAVFTWIYSSPPLRTKRHWFWANFTISVPRGALLKVAGWSSAASILYPEPWYIGLIFFLYLLGAASTKDFADMRGDEALGVRTLPIKFGVRRASWMIAPFLVFPFVLLPLGAWSGVLHGHPAGLTVLGVLLTLYGLYISYLILKHPEALATDSNHVSWTHMYLLMMVAQVGILVCYWIR